MIPAPCSARPSSRQARCCLAFGWPQQGSAACPSLPFRGGAAGARRGLSIRILLTTPVRSARWVRRTPSGAEAERPGRALSGPGRALSGPGRALSGPGRALSGPGRALQHPCRRADVAGESRLLAGATVIAIATSAGVLTAASPPAMGAPMPAGLSVRAETSADARAAADDLQTQVDHATADYAGALQAAASAVSGHLRAEAASGVARRDAEDSRDRLDEHLRALYKSGGPTAVYASVLGADSIVEALDRVRSVERVVSTDRQVVTASEQAGGRAERGATDAAALAQRQVAVERQAGVAASRVQAVSLIHISEPTRRTPTSY